MARCPECTKFVSISTETEPEVGTLEIDDEGTVSVNVRIVNTCDECGADLKEASFDMETDALVDIITQHIEKLSEQAQKSHTLDIEEIGTDRIERVEKRKSRYGAAVNFTVSCSCEGDAKLALGGSVEDTIPASEMEDC